MTTPPPTAREQRHQLSHLRSRLIRLDRQLDHAAYQLDLARQRHALVMSERVRVQAQVDQLAGALTAEEATA